jgi:hypothetical protein
MVFMAKNFLLAFGMVAGMSVAPAMGIDVRKGYLANSFLCFVSVVVIMSEKACLANSFLCFLSVVVMSVRSFVRSLYTKKTGISQECSPVNPGLVLKYIFFSTMRR